MSIGSDISTVYTEVGTAITIYRDSGDISGEFIDFELNSQVTKPFIREHFLESNFQYDTSGEVGDILQFQETGTEYMLMNKTPEVFENNVISWSSTLYKVNVSGELSRPSGTSRNAQYRTTDTWSTVKLVCRALLTETLFGHELQTDQELGNIGIERHELYLPASIGAAVNDRYEPVSGEFLRLEVKKGRRYAGVEVFECGEDTRQG